MFIRRREQLTPSCRKSAARCEIAAAKLSRALGKMRDRQVLGKRPVLAACTRRDGRCFQSAGRFVAGSDHCQSAPLTLVRKQMQRAAERSAARCGCGLSAAGLKIASNSQLRDPFRGRRPLRSKHNEPSTLLHAPVRSWACIRRLSLPSAGRSCRIEWHGERPGRTQTAGCARPCHAGGYRS